MSYINQSAGWFRYFAYGSNLSSLRIHLDNPSAEKIGIGKLMDYELYFGVIGGKDDNLWSGGCASIREKLGKEVWGVVWRIDLVDLPNLDRQEKGYVSKTVTVKMSYGESLICCTYKFPECCLLPPTPAYKDICIEGAREHHLPEEYITKLLAVEDNGNHEIITPTMLRLAEAKKKLQERACASQLMD